MAVWVGVKQNPRQRLVLSGGDIRTNMTVVSNIVLWNRSQYINSLQPLIRVWWKHHVLDSASVHAAYCKGVQDLFRGIKRVGHVVFHPPQSSHEVQTGQGHTSVQPLYLQSML
jgi:hypothetical protein